MYKSGVHNDIACMDAGTYDLSGTKIMTVHPEHSSLLAIDMQGSTNAVKAGCLRVAWHHDIACMDAGTYDLSGTKIMTVRPEHSSLLAIDVQGSTNAVKAGCLRVACHHDIACMDAGTYDLSGTKIMTVRPEHKSLHLQAFYNVNYIELHIRIIRATGSLWCHPSNILAWVFNITCFTVDTILSINNKLIPLVC